MSIKNTIKFLTLGFLTLALMSCEIVRKESPIWHWTSSDEEKTEYFEEICSAYGYKYGTPAMSQCVTLERRSSSSAAADRFSTGLQNMQNNMNNRFNNTSTTTNCQRWGSGINCTSY